VNPDGATFVGRSVELERLRARLVRARAGSGAVLALVGEAGIGKTRLAQAFAAQAREDGAVVAFGTCAEGEWTPPLDPWSQVLGALVRELGGRAAQSAAGAGRGTLAWFVRELTANAPAPVLDARDERQRMHRSVLQLLERASAGASRRKDPGEAVPLVLVFDDVQWADPDSLVLLQTIARRAATSPWLIVLAYREAEVDHGRTPLGDVLGALNDGDFERISLRGLALPEVDALARSGAKRPLSEALVRVVFDETVGNPLYVGEFLRLLADEGTLARVATSEDVSMRQLGVPRGVRDVIARRFARLSEHAARVLRITACLPEASDLPLLLAVSELDAPKLRTAIAAAIGAGFLREAAEGCVEPAHSLVRRVVHDGIQPDLRVRLHRRIAESLEASGERRPGLEALIAGQYHASAAIAGVELGVPHAVEAAREAQAACAQERAVAFLRRARTIATSAPPHVRAEALCELALAEARALRTDEAVRATEDALAALATTGTPTEDIAEFLFEVARELKSGGAGAACWGAVAERALPLLGRSRSITWARLTLIQERFEPLAYGAVNLARALPRDADAVRIARMDGDEDDYAASLDDAPRTRSEAEQLVKMAAKWQRPTARLRAMSVVVGELVFRHAAFADARAHAETMLDVATRAGSIRGQADALVHLATCDAALGAIARATELRTRARELAAAIGTAHASAPGAWLGLDAMLAYYAGGEWRGLAEAAARAMSDPAARLSPDGHVAAAIASLAYALGGHAREARQLLGHLAAIFERSDGRLHHYGVALGCATTAVWHLGARDLAEKYAALERGAPPFAGSAPYASRDVNLGRMAVLLERWDEARDHLSRADVLLARRKLRPLHAIALHDGAAAVLRSGEQAGAAKARSKLAASLRAFRVLGMDPWILHAHRLLDLPRPSYPDGLTSREVEILAMIGEGREVQGIAQALGVAAQAARKEAARACAKIGARGRRAAAAYAIDHRFVDGDS
jgi:DNA-binding CsgD family transcriptional regulator